MGVSSVMVIDDDKMFQFIAKRMIHGVLPESNILQFPDGADALKFIKDSQTNGVVLPNLILLDINMPVVNGWLFLDELSKTDLIDYCPVIHMISSSGDPVDREMAEKNRFISSYLTKPITRLMLATIIDGA